MKKFVGVAGIVLILVALFLTSFLPQHNLLPRHVDAWQVVTKADAVIDNRAVSVLEPFSETVSFYPPGAHLHLAILQSISNINLLFISNILPALFMVILGLLLYALSKLLFKNELVSITIMAFTPLSLSNITMLGPYYLVPLAWGMIISLLAFYFLIKKSWLLFFISFIALSLTHNSSMVFALIGIALFFIFNKSYWRLVKYLLILILAAIIIFIAISGSFSYLLSISLSFFAFDKASPFINFQAMFPPIFLLFLALGFYFILVNEREASRFLIPLFAFLAINAFLYWNWMGFFLVYRRLFTFLFLMSVFFVGYGVFCISSNERIIGRGIVKLRKSSIILILAIIILLPIAIKANLQAHISDVTLVNNNENILFRDFGNLNPNTSVATDHLQAFALPYYNLRPVQLSPAHGTDILYYEELHLCYESLNTTCFENFFKNHNVTYLYIRIPINSTYFKPYFKYNQSVIYRFQD